MHHLSLSNTPTLALGCLVSSLLLTGCDGSKVTTAPPVTELEQLPETPMPKMVADEQAPPPTGYRLAPDCELQYRFNVTMSQEMLCPMTVVIRLTRLRPCGWKIKNNPIG